jgi:hypothetical protein
MILVSEHTASAVEETLKSTSVDGITPSTLYEGGYVRAVYNIPDDRDLDDFEGLLETGLKQMFPEIVVEKQVMFAHIKS